MNGTEQRTHTRKTDALAQTIAETQSAVIERFEEVEARMQQFRERLEEVRRDMRTVQLTALQTHDDLWLRVGDVECQLSARLDAIEERTFWQRLCWLVRGY